ncbi:hypothetical protein RKLH11_2625 [Rhodobacteraceae bacterium KLH11]|nr:hypothetical protein RKLH11_2625 [Rhodobacteraceae bacterium KLH11]
MMILKEQKLVFIKTKKTAGSSIEIALGQLLKPGDFASPLTNDEERLRRGKRKIVLNSVKLLRERGGGKVRVRDPHAGFEVVKRYLPDIAEDCTSFCVERNPWDKAVSAFYFWMHQRKLEITNPTDQFAGFCRAQVRYFSSFGQYSENGEVVVDKVLQYDNLRTEFDDFMKEMGVEAVSLDSVRAKSGIRKSKRFELFYGDDWSFETVDQVAKVFRREIDVFGYDIPRA